MILFRIFAKIKSTCRLLLKNQTSLSRLRLHIFSEGGCFLCLKVMEEIKELLLKYYKDSNLSSLEITFKLENKRMINESGEAVANNLKIAEVETKIKY